MTYKRRRSQKILKSIFSQCPVAAPALTESAITATIVAKSIKLALSTRKEKAGYAFG